MCVIVVFPILFLNIRHVPTTITMLKTPVIIRSVLFIQPRLSSVIKGRPVGHNSMSHSLVNRSSGFLRMHVVLYMTIIMYDALYFCYK